MDKVAIIPSARCAIKSSPICAQKQTTSKADASRSLSRVELSEYLGVNRSALTRELAQMREEGLIDFEKNTFILR